MGPIYTDSTTLAVREGDRTERRTRLYQRTHFGPIIHRDGNRAYAYRLTLSDDVQQIEQYYRMMTARDQKGFYEALKLNHLPPERIVYGDVYGNIAYFVTGRTPIRSEFFTWDRPVSGNTSETEWLGFHGQDEMPQIVNPKAEWIEDCDASPDRITPAAGVTSPLQPDYMSQYLPTAESPRSFRARTLLSLNTRLTVSEAISYSQDTYAIHSERWIRALNIAAAQHGDALLTEKVAILNAWDGRADTGSKGMALYAGWRDQCERAGRDIQVASILSAQPLGGSTANALVRAFSDALVDLERKGQRSTWGEIHRLRDDADSWPLAGSSYGLRAIQSTVTDSTREAHSGPSQTILMCFRAPNQIDSYSVVPFGQTDFPGSAHAIDQAGQFYSWAKLKPTQFGISPGSLQHQRTLDTP